MLAATKKILLISASLIALSGSTLVIAGPDERSSLMSEQVQQQLNSNSASATEIASTLKGIGLKTAEAIVAFREANGAFTSIESITQVKGVGSKTLKKNSARIVLQ